MPFYVSPEQIMRDKADYAASRIARIRSCVALQYTGGILMVAPNPSTSRHKISELYDRIAFAAGGRYNEYEALRKAGVTYADITGYQFDRRDVTGLGLANWYAQTLGTIFTDSTKPYEVEIVVAEVGMTPDNDQIYRITFDGSVSDEPGFVAFGGQADQVSARLKERFHDGMSLAEALGAALDALTAPNTNNQGSAGSSASQAGNGQPAELTASQLEVAILDRARAHRTFRRLRGPRLEELLTESRAAAAGSGGSDPADSGSASADAGSGSADAGSGSADAGSGDSAGSGSAGPSAPSSPSTGPDEPPTGPTAAGGDGIPRPPTAS